MLSLSNSVAEDGFIARQFLTRLPRNFKKMVFVSSVFGLILNGGDPNLELIGKLNDIINLTKDTKTCEFPIYIRRAIWRNLDCNNLGIGNGQSIAITEIIKSNLSTENCASIGEQIARSAPKWLNYGSNEVMANDVIVLIKSLKHLLVGTPRFAQA